MKNFNSCLRKVAFAAVAVASGPLLAADWVPTRAIEILVPYGPGGTTDIMARVSADYLSKKWNVPVNVVNKPGGNTIPAQVEFYKAPPDGHTVTSESPGATSILPMAVKQIPFNVTERTFIASVGTSPNVLVIKSDGPYKTAKDLVEDIKREPGSFVFSSFGGASSPDAGIRQLTKAIGVDFSKTKPVVGGITQSVSNVAGGHTKAAFSTATTSMPLIKGGLIKPVAITGEARHPDFPEVPTFKELGLPTVTVLNWSGFTAPPKVPANIVAGWENALKEMLNDPQVIKRFKDAGIEPKFGDSTYFKGFVVKELEAYKSLVQ